VRRSVFESAANWIGGTGQTLEGDLEQTSLTTKSRSGGIR